MHRRNGAPDSRRRLQTERDGAMWSAAWTREPDAQLLVGEDTTAERGDDGERLDLAIHDDGRRRRIAEHAVVARDGKHNACGVSEASEVASHRIATEA